MRLWSCARRRGCPSKRCAHGLRGCTHDHHAKYFGRARLGREPLGRIRHGRSCDPRLGGAGPCAALAIGTAVSTPGREPATTPATPGFRRVGARTSSASRTSLRGAEPASGAPHAADSSGGAAQPARGQLRLELYLRCGGGRGALGGVEVSGAYDRAPELSPPRAVTTQSCHHDDGDDDPGGGAHAERSLEVIP